MSYPDALKKLKSVYDRVSSNVADVLVEIELYEDLFKKSATDINNLLKRFNIDNWHFYTPQPRSCFRVEHINDDVMEAQNKRIYTSASSLVSYPSPSSNLSGFREDIDKSLLSVIRRSRLNLPLFMDRGVKIIRTIESLVTEDLRRDLSDIANELNQSYENVMRMISKVQGISDSYRKALTTREQQAANEWFAEGYVKKGMNLKLLLSSIGYPYHSEEIIGIVDNTVVTTEREYPELLRLNSQSSIPYTDYDEIRKATWRTYNSNIDVDKIINLEKYVDNFEKKYME